MRFQTVTGAALTEEVRLADGHAHLWIAPPVAVAADARFELSDELRITAELRGFRAAGGTLLVDCQPGGCGRNGDKLVALSRATGLQVTAVTGFHLRKYYAPEDALWSASAEAAADQFIAELTVGLPESTTGARATLIKVGFEGTIEGQVRILMEAAAQAARKTGAAILFHTEAGRNVEALLPFFTARGVSADQLYMCHMDKRPDHGLHRELAAEGVLLGYDTFGRLKYDPDRHVWPLIHAMVAAGFDHRIAIGLDFAHSTQWQHYGGGPGLRLLPDVILPRLRAEGLSEATIHRLTARNIAERLAALQEVAE